MTSRHLLLMFVAAACGKSGESTPLADFKAKNATKIEALKTNLQRAATVATAALQDPPPAAACKGLALQLNGKKGVGNAEILWAEEIADVLAGKLQDSSKSRFLVSSVDLSGWCQLLSSTLYWLDDATKTDLNTSGVSAKVKGWIASALDLDHVVLLVPGTASRGEQKVEVRVVELASGAVRCATTVSGHADPALGVEYYDVIRTRTGEKVGTHKLDKYRQAMQADLAGKLSQVLRNELAMNMRGYCAHPE